jgi:hypothetical protein
MVAQRCIKTNEAMNWSKHKTNNALHLNPNARGTKKPEISMEGELPWILAVVSRSPAHFRKGFSYSLAVKQNGR